MSPDTRNLIDTQALADWILSEANAELGRAQSLYRRVRRLYAACWIALAVLVLAAVVVVL